MTRRKRLSIIIVISFVLFGGLYIIMFQGISWLTGPSVAYTTGSIEFSIEGQTQKPCDSIVVTCKQSPVAVEYRQDIIEFKANTYEKDMYEFIVKVPKETFEISGLNKQLIHSFSLFTGPMNKKGTRYKINIDYKKKHGEWIAEIHAEVEYLGKRNKPAVRKEFPISYQNKTSIVFGP